MMRWSIPALLLSVAGCAAQPTRVEVAARSAARAPVKAIFHFVSSARFNLHERILLPATARFAPPPGAKRDWPAPALDPQRQAAIAAYRQRITSMLGERNAAAQRELMAVDDGAFCATKRPAAVPAQICALYDDYRAKQWSADDASNRRWIAEVSAVSPHRWQAIRERLVEVYRTPWPKTRLTVQVTAEVGGPGAAYTLNNPLITISSSDARHRGKRAVEVLFHEASHLLDGRLRRTLSQVGEELGLSVPGALWHAALFYLTGAVVKEQLGPDYVPYAEAQGLYRRGGFKGWLPPLQAAWRPYLAGKIDMAEAAKRLLEAVTAPRAE